MSAQPDRMTALSRRAQECATQSLGIFLMAHGAGSEMPACGSLMGPIVDAAAALRSGLEELADGILALGEQPS